MTNRIRALAALAALVLAPCLARAQRAAATAAAAAGRSPDCDYARCALGIAPVWNGLAVVRGPARQPVANLNFFVPRSVAGAFVGDSALAYARRASGVRRLAAAFTDGGGLLLAVSAVRAASAGQLDTGGRVLAATGAAAFLVGIPLQFSADGLLSRAVWWHNAAFAR